eukprot:TRINITY_DN5687_c0_g1_i1.p1 TRINITY_DN5687_c0_g1~~TRINITY_DN5687_c0_g1_i1.p1  ORF type:complete len:520 (+),score=42.49 TRINITY_DN5687_c0_g1_i1:331-1890(+)
MQPSTKGIRRTDGTTATVAEEVLQARERDEINMDHFAGFKGSLEHPPDEALVATRGESACGIGSVPNACPAGHELSGLLCYPVCKAGYEPFGCCLCRKICPPQFTDIGVACTKPAAIGRGTGHFSERACEEAVYKGNNRRLLGPKHSASRPYTANSCEKTGLFWYPKCTNWGSFHNVACCICSPNCPPGFTDTGAFCNKDTYGRTARKPATCPAGKVNVVGLCYNLCRCQDECGTHTLGWIKSKCNLSCPSWDKTTGVCCKPTIYAKAKQIFENVGTIVTGSVNKLAQFMIKGIDDIIDLGSKITLYVAEGIIWSPLQKLLTSLGNGFVRSISEALTFGQLGASLAAPYAGIQKNFFPDVVSGSLNYVHNNWLLKQAQLTIPMQVSGYLWTKTHAEREISKYFAAPITKGEPEEAVAYCPSPYVKGYTPTQEIMRSTSTVETEISLFVQDNGDDETLIVIVVRGSQLWQGVKQLMNGEFPSLAGLWVCLLYTSDAADEEDSVDLGGRRIIKKKKKYTKV